MSTEWPCICLKKSGRLKAILLPFPKKKKKRMKEINKKKNKETLNKVYKANK